MDCARLSHKAEMAAVLKSLMVEPMLTPQDVKPVCHVKPADSSGGMWRINYVLIITLKNEFWMLPIGWNKQLKNIPKYVCIVVLNDMLVLQLLYH